MISESLLICVGTCPFESGKYVLKSLDDVQNAFDGKKNAVKNETRSLDREDKQGISCQQYFVFCFPIHFAVLVYF